MTPTVSPLPIEGSPVPGESLMGFVLRMSVTNHLNGIQWLGTVLGKDRIFHLSIDHIPTISWVFGAPLESFRDISISFMPGTQNSYWNFYSHPISRSYLIRHRMPQLCSKCIEEAGVIKKIWDLRSVTVCPAHGILLLDRCDRCGKLISWNRPSIFSCSCQFDFRRSKASFVDQEECMLANNLEIKLMEASAPFYPATLKDPFSLLNTLSIDGAARVIHATGILHDRFDLMTVGKSKKDIRTKEMHEIVKRSITRFSKITFEDKDRRACSEFLTTTLLTLEQDGFTQNDRDFAWHLIYLGRKGLPNRASLLNRNPRSQLKLL
jgi:hypothetical protein